MQETDFPFEVIVHDDASTDETPRIIEEYARKYPELIRPILEEENQFGKGVSITLDIVLPRIQGRYVAFCEGDDFWIDAHKLQRQYEYMENNEDCMICIHNALVENLLYGYAHYSEHVGDDRDKTFAQVVQEACGLMNCTASFFIRTSVLRDHVKVSRDFVILTTAAKLGRVHWLGKPMSVYRRGVAGSYNERKESFDSQYVQAEAKKGVAYLESISCGLDASDREAVGAAIESRNRNAAWWTDRLHFLEGELGLVSCLRKWGWYSTLKIVAYRMPQRIRRWGGVSPRRNETEKAGLLRFGEEARGAHGRASGALA